MSDRFMLRALELATLGRGHVSPNPMVGCVITHGAEGGERIIGEGWHQRYGEAHAERNAILSVRPEEAHLLPESTVYVTLEPCSHYGKQPPCADLLIDRCVGRVVCCNDDPNPLVAGQGFQKLRTAGIAVETGVLREQGRELNARFFTFFEQQRPYILLKWAESADGYIAGIEVRTVKISGDLSHRLVHRWRTEEDAIMVGTNTARLDNPRLNVRLVPGRNPTRIVIDKQLKLAGSLNLFDNSQPTLGYNYLKTETLGQTTYIQLQPDKPFLNQLLDDLYGRRIQSVLVEGGTTLINSLLEAGLWDEMRVFRSPMVLDEGVKAPVVRGRLVSREQVGVDELTVYKNSPGN
ncbi:bifunctional diaminohydroxyphosphoribosylaminopyrimidine deaminase/5-amino-6-(5-phosphoribosylamino)uracil reductase RibD [Spirosoma taeanense]|uniref:Riboflavin biosynthesis protein RibD n=1 Tax=Spirosoma taeanense TaxID=2735870 RepID=A0A6M5Y742_9BACT|nr:bifunctional diaminohydroxyphosphoribosylaminopyrimidine deaminase/5-amino-6-(5-phosphoribosylamino)uracil reductase RibD [Spirosoma taeanense]QJW89719.1 bifunctional diaminohydroxyphosphoribosylaminopyrimidine deaminase/5-amino-6-(5-phosphoribosylamino)uracil reductase RibD [Spirosoma taeanense]